MLVSLSHDKHFLSTLYTLSYLFQATHLDKYYRLCAKDEEIKEVMQLVHRSYSWFSGHGGRQRLKSLPF